MLILKLGGSVITDKSKPFTPRLDVIRRLAKEIHEARQEKGIKLIIGHGGGSFPHTSAKKYETHKGIINEESYRGICMVQNDASKLNRIMVDELIKAGENAISIQPSSSCITKKGRISEWYFDPIKKVLEYDLLPVVYGDVALDTEMGCCIISTEEIMNYLARNFKSSRLLIGGKVDGVFTSDPNRNKEGKFIPVITKENFPEIKKYLTSSDGIDVTGGMLHKVERLLELTDLGIESEIINVDKPNVLKMALLGKKVLGTIVK